MPVTLDEILTLIDAIVEAGGERSAKLKKATEKLRLISHSSQAPIPMIGVTGALNALGRTDKVMEHKMATVRERVNHIKKQVTDKTSKPDFAPLKIALRAQLEVVKLANKQADGLLKQIDLIAKQ